MAVTTFGSMQPYDKEQRELAKLDAEIAKIEAERRHVERSEWKKISSYSVLIPTIIAVISIPFLAQFWNARKEMLQRDIARFEDQRSSLSNEMVALVSSRDSLLEERDELREENAALVTRQADLGKRINEVSATISGLFDTYANISNQLVAISSERVQDSKTRNAAMDQLQTKANDLRNDVQKHVTLVHKYIAIKQQLHGLVQVGNELAKAANDKQRNAAPIKAAVKFWLDEAERALALVAVKD